MIAWTNLGIAYSPNRVCGKMHMPSRHVSEFGINMFASGSMLLQDEDLPHVSKWADDDAEFHLYAITARPRISIDPSQFQFTQESIKGTFLAQDGPTQVAFHFEIGHPPQGIVTRLESKWPHTYFQLLNDNGRVVSGKAAAIASVICPEMGDHLDLEVLYIGQSYGKTGERTASDRLQSHSTLQQILGETSRLQPDREIWLALFHFDEVAIASFDGRLANRDPEASRADEGRLERFLSGSVSVQQEINFTEAALIRYFEPKYNTMFRKKFPSPEHLGYRQCYDLDLNMVAAELDTEPLHARLYSEARPASWQHFAMFPLHDRKERVYMLDLLLPEGSSG